MRALRRRRVALLGNPNTGKSTLFNALTGLSQRVGNYPGVTVERSIGRLSEEADVVDLPGTYSLAAKSPDELLVLRTLIGDLDGEPPPDLIVVIVDATNLTRNLYLASQVLELGRPTVVALNMMDAATRVGLHIDTDALSAALGVPIVPTVATRSRGLDELRSAIAERLDVPPPPPPIDLDSRLAPGLVQLAERCGTHAALLRRALIDEGGPSEAEAMARLAENDAVELLRLREDLRARNRNPAAIEAETRYAWIRDVVSRSVRREGAEPRRESTIDALLTHRVTGLAVFVLVMTAVFLSIFKFATPAMDAIDTAFGALGTGVRSVLAGTSLEGGRFESLIVDGMIGGVGGVVIFLPQIALLFLFIGLLESCGYMARAAFLVDRVMRACGLTGHSFIPMLSSFACAIPGVLSTRAIRDPKDRLTTMLVAPLMSCSARLPVYTIMIAALVPAIDVAGFLPLQGVVFTSMYFVGMIVAVIVAWALRRTVLRGDPSPFVLELPPFRVPGLRPLALRVVHAVRSFLVRAGTIIFAMSILIWAAGSFPEPPGLADEIDRRRSEASESLAGEALADALAAIEADAAGARLRGSLLGRLGHVVEPLVRPLGWDWRMGTAALAAFPARELLVSTLNILYGLDAEEDAGLSERLRSQYGPPAERGATATAGSGGESRGLAVALSVMVFIALCCQCVSTLVVIGRETGTWRWPVFAFIYMTALAWLGAFLVYQGASRLLG